MAPQNRRIATLRDIKARPYDYSNEGENSSLGISAVERRSSFAVSAATGQVAPPPGNTTYCQPTSKQAPLKKIPLCHIPNLPMEDACGQTLERVWKEFEHIIRRRGYNVKSISELCCCGDGLDIQPDRKRRLRKQSNSVWGYNQTSFFRRGGGPSSKSHTIHLRLRQPRDHTTQLLSWEDVAGTMAHELSHCIHQNHSQEFYKLMEEILEEHATLQVQSMGKIIYGGTGPSDFVTPSASMPETGGQRLGGKFISNVAGKSRLLDGNGGQRKLGGNTIGMRPPLPASSRREAMAQAAEHRRRQMEQLRRMIQASKEPCVIEILDNDDCKSTGESNNTIQAVDGESQPKARREAASTSGESVSGMTVNDEPVVDITSRSTPRMTKRPRAGGDEPIDLTSPSGTPTVPIGPGDICQKEEIAEWPCSRCTFRNRPIVMVCEICHAQTELTNYNEREHVIEID